MKDEDLKLLVQNLMSTDFGRKYIKEIINRTGCLDNSVCFENANKNYYLQGKREIGYSILKDIHKYSYKNYEELLERTV